MQDGEYVNAAEAYTYGNAWAMWVCVLDERGGEVERGVYGERGGAAGEVEAGG